MSLCLLVLGLAIRANGLDSAPVFGETGDEFAWTWAGMSLVQDGSPRAWSWYPAYDESPIKPEIVLWHDRPYRMVQPWVDHPPVYPLWMGLWMTMLGYDDVLAVDLAAMRTASLVLFALSFLAFGAVLSRLVQPGVRIATLGCFAIAAPAVLQGRLVISENLLTLWVLLCLFAMLRFEESGKRRFLVLTAAMTFVLPLTKIAALSLCFGALLFAAANRNWKLAGAVVAGTAMGAVGVLAAGYVIAGDLFGVLLTSHVAQFSGFYGAFPMLFSPKIVHTPIYYGPFLLGAIVLFGGLISGERVRLALVAIGYAMGMSFFMNQNGPGWYEIPLYPFLCVGVGVTIAKMWQTDEAWPLILWVMFAVPALFDPLLGRARGPTQIWTWELSAWRWSYLALILTVPTVTLLFGRSNRTLRRFGVTLLLALQALAELNIVRRWDGS